MGARHCSESFTCMYLFNTIILWSWSRYIFCFTDDSVEAEKFHHLPKIIAFTSDEPTAQILAICFTLISIYYLHFRVDSVLWLCIYFLISFAICSLIYHEFWILIIKFTMTGSLNVGLLKRKLEMTLCNFWYFWTFYTFIK